MLRRAQMAVDEGRGLHVLAALGAHHQQAVPAIGTGHAQAFLVRTQAAGLHTVAGLVTRPGWSNRGSSSSCPSKRAWRRAPGQGVTPRMRVWTSAAGRAQSI